MHAFFEMRLSGNVRSRAYIRVLSNLGEGASIKFPFQSVGPESGALVLFSVKI